MGEAVHWKILEDACCYLVVSLDISNDSAILSEGVGGGVQCSLL